MVELKRIFDCNEVAQHKKALEEKGNDECESYNLDTDDDLNMVNIGKEFNPQERDKMLCLLTM